MAPRIKKIEIQGFRAFGKNSQSLAFGGLIAAVWAPNSQGKTSLAEAFEFLLTGQIVRRQLMASTQDEFADALRNAHMPAANPVYVEAEIVAADGSAHTLKRTLVSDYAKRHDCQSTLEIDGAATSEDGLARLGIALSQPPLAAPVLAQHTLGYLFSARPQDRATYFKTIFEVTDLEVLRGAVATAGAEFLPEDDANWIRLSAAAEIAEANPFLIPLLTAVPERVDLVGALDNAITAILTTAGGVMPAAQLERITALETLLAERRAKTFPVGDFERKALADWSVPAQADRAKIDDYLSERAKLDEEARRLTVLFAEALAIPAVAGATEAVDCMLCGTEGSLTPERIAFIRDQLKEAEVFKDAERAALEFLRRLSAETRALETGFLGASPRFLTTTSAKRRKTGFRIERIRTLLAEEDSADGAIALWLKKLRALARAKTAIQEHINILAREIAGYITNPDSLDNLDSVNAQFDAAAGAYNVFSEALAAYSAAEQPLTSMLTAVIDAASDTKGWQELIDLACDPDGLRDSLIERHARDALQEELVQALRQIDRGNEKVLADKFTELSAGIQHWWDLLRPGEPTFFSSVIPRKGARRTIDFKAGLSLHTDRSAPKLRDVIAVFSQSQLHCLGLALFLARVVHEGSGFVVLDDPILSSDEDYRAYFKSAVLESLLDAGIQVIILTQDQKSWKDLEHRYLHNNIDMFQMALIDPADGTSVNHTSDDLMAMLSRVEVLVRGGHTDLRKQAGEILRNAAERFCKEILVRDRWKQGDSRAALSDYDGKNLGELGPKVESMLTADPSHPGKLRSIGNELNPAKHDEGVPPHGTLKVALGDLQQMRKQYLRV